MKTNKKCSKCGGKSLALNYLCKSCKTLYDKERYKKNRDRLLANIKRYHLTPRGILVARETRDRMSKKYPEKKRARNRVGLAIFYGKIKKGICDICGGTKVEAHHSDYKKPLEVRWLCPAHHRQIEGRSIC